MRRFFRPEDVSRDHAYGTEWSEVYAGPEEEEAVPVDLIVGKCSVRLGRAPAAAAAAAAGTSEEAAGKPVGSVPPSAFKHVFWCTGSYDPGNPAAGVTAAPSTLRRSSSAPAAAAAADAGGAKGKAARGGAKGKAAQEAAAAAAAATAKKAGEAERQLDQEDEQEVPDGAVALATMDIFAGCGGLSEGMHQAGVADTRWGVEYDGAAADAFQKNNPDAKVWDGCGRRCG